MKNVLPTLVVEPIGIIRTVFHEKYEAPRQPLADDGLNTSSGAVIELVPHKNYEQALADLEGFERIWLVSWFNRNANWKPKILPPRGHTKRGVFATRSPHRPNPLGISVVTLYAVTGLRVVIGSCDLLDGTPILDIKPYISEYDAHVPSAAGWWDAERSEEQRFTVVFSQMALEQRDFLRSRGINSVDVAVSKLIHDPFPHPYRRIKALAEGKAYFEIAVQSWRLRYRIGEGLESGNVFVDEVQSGYSREQMQTPEAALFHNSEAHKEFYQRW